MRLNDLIDGDVGGDLDIWLEDRNEIIEFEGSAVKVWTSCRTNIRGRHAVSYRRAQHTSRMLNGLKGHCSPEIAWMVGTLTSRGKGCFLHGDERPFKFRIATCIPHDKGCTVVSRN